MITDTTSRADPARLAAHRHSEDAPSPWRRRRPVRAVTVAVGLVLMAAACSSTEQGATTTTAATTSQPDVGQSVDLGGGRQLYLDCRGSGSPTVVLVSGARMAGDLWDSPLGGSPRVFPTVAETTRVCIYDRPGTTRAQAAGGISRSDAVVQPTAPRDAVADLHAVLAAAGETGPYVLAGHSYGGVVSRLYAHTYPQDVKGMVLVDSFSPELQDNMTAEQWAIWKSLNATKAADLADYPDLEQIDFDDTLQQVRDAISIPPMPLIVLTADHPTNISNSPPEVPADFGAVIDGAHHTAQSQVAQLVPDAKWITDTHSGHNMMLDQPQLVTNAILEVIAAVRDGSTSMS